MPELPEVETVRRGLSDLIIGKVVSGETHDTEKGFPNASADVKQFLIGASIIAVRRRAKVLMIDLSTDYSLLIHLKMTGQLVFVGETRFGAGHPNDSLINEPMDFTTHNNLPLEDLRQLLQSVMFPASVPPSQRFHLSKQDYQFLYQYLSQYPSETNYPKYDTAQYFDSYVKFFFKPGSRSIPPYIRVFNKVGWSYGCMTDVSYITDFKNKVEFMLAATMYVNKDGILNDDKYEYEETALPFFYTIGQHLYQYELKRKRKYKPDLSAFKINYEHRVPDSRQSIRDADN